MRAALAAAGVATRIVELSAAARTARAAAEQIGCDVAQIANSLVFRCSPSGAPLLVMASGAKRVDVARVGAVVGETIGKADAEFVRAATGFVIGGVAPVGHVAPVRTLDRPHPARVRRDLGGGRSSAHRLPPHAGRARAHHRRDAVEDVVVAR